LEPEYPSKRLKFKWYKTFEHFQKHNASTFFQSEQESPIIVLAHEFFDALPANIFTYQKNLGWCEKLVNIDHTGENPFEYILSDVNSPNVQKILAPEKAFPKSKLLIRNTRILAT
jgi:SAM-dependent MidA family methyltransferase